MGTDPVLSDPLKRQGQIPPLCLVCHLLPVPDGGSGARDVLGTLLRAWRLMMVRFNNHCNCTFSAADEIVVQESWWKEKTRMPFPFSMKTAKLQSLTLLISTLSY